MAQNSPALPFKPGRISALTCMVAALSMAATPAYAVEALPEVEAEPVSAFGLDWSDSSFDATGIETEAETSGYYGRRYRGYRRYRRNRIDGGDILAGVLIIGGIAAIASAASNNNRRERERVVERRRYEDRRYDDRRYNDRRSNPRSSNGSGLDTAVNMCLREIEQDVRVESVDGASRVASGWMVSGTLFNGSGFSCQIDNNGRISSIDYGGFSGVSADEVAPGQWSETRYSEARARMAPQSPTSQTAQVREASYASAEVDGDLSPLVDVNDDQPQPAYPGGPLPGEEFAEEPSQQGG